MPARTRLMHFVQHGDTSGLFPALATLCNRARFEVTFGTLAPITGAFRGQLEAAGVAWFSLDAPERAGYPSAWARLVRHLRQNPVDIFHAHLFDPAVVGLSAALAARVPIRVLTRHYSDYHTRIHKHWHVRLDRMCTAMSHRVIAVSEQTARVMLEEEHARLDKIVVIHNGMNRARAIAPPAGQLACLRAELGLAGHAVLACVARLHPEKGHTHLFSALAKLRSRVARPVTLLVCGEGPSREAYEAEVSRLDLADAVRFLGYRHDVPAILCLADVVVLPSVAEAFGIVLVEAMALARPIVATTAGGIPEVVEEGRQGLLVPPGDADALASAIGRILQDRAFGEALGAAGPARAAGFTFEQMVARYEAAYERLVAARGRG